MFITSWEIDKNHVPYLLLFDMTSGFKEIYNGFWVKGTFVEIDKSKWSTVNSFYVFNVHFKIIFLFCFWIFNFGLILSY